MAKHYTHFINDKTAERFNDLPSFILPGTKKLEIQNKVCLVTVPIFFTITYNVMNRWESFLFPTNPFLDLTFLARKKAHTEYFTSFLFLFLFLIMAMITMATVTGANTALNYSNDANSFVNFMFYKQQYLIRHSFSINMSVQIVNISFRNS